MIDTQGQVYTFGGNDFGKLGHGDYTKRTIPTKITSLAKAGIRCVHAACADNHTLLLADHGIVFGFGLNRSGEIGQGQSDDICMFPNPQKIQLGSSAFDVVTVRGGSVLCLSFSHAHPMIQHGTQGRNHSLVNSTGGVYSFGQNVFRQLGRDVQVGYTPGYVSFEMAKNPRIIQMDAGKSHSVLLDNQGFVYTSGKGMCGQLGHDDKMFSVNIATRIESLSRKAKQVAAANSTTFVVRCVRSVSSFSFHSLEY